MQRRGHSRCLAINKDRGNLEKNFGNCFLALMSVYYFFFFEKKATSALNVSKFIICCLDCKDIMLKRIFFRKAELQGRKHTFIYSFIIRNVDFYKKE